MLAQQLSAAISGASSVQTANSIIIGGTWQIAVDSSGSLSFQKWVNGAWVEKGTFS
jgi:hypothetical protein